MARNLAVHFCRGVRAILLGRLAISFALLSIIKQPVGMAQTEPAFTIQSVRYLPYSEEILPSDRILADETLPWIELPQQLPPSYRSWIKIRFRAIHTAPTKSVSLIMDKTPDRANLYLFDQYSNLLSESRFGSFVPISNWQSFSLAANQVFYLPHDGDFTILLSLDTSAYSSSDFQIVPRHAAVSVEIISMMSLMSVLGCLCSALVYNLILWRSLRRGIFLKAATLTALYALFALAEKGILGSVIASLVPALCSLAAVVPFLCISAFFGFSVAYLRLESDSKTYSTTVSVSHTILLCGAIAPFNSQFSQIVATIAFMIGFTTLNVQMFRFAAKRRKDAIILLIASFPMILICEHWTPLYLPLPGSFDVHGVLPWAMLGQILCVGGGLAERIGEVRRQLLGALAERAESLESMVRDRTANLKKVNDELTREVEERRLAQLRAVEQARLLEEAQARVVSASRLGALGEMAAGVSHEINNPLTILKGNLYLLQDCLDGDSAETDRMKTLIVKGLTAADRVSKVVRGLRDFALQDQFDNPVDSYLTSSWDLCFDLVRHRISQRGIRCEIQQWDPEIVVWVRPADLTQALIACLNNAIDAVDKSRDKWIRIRVLADDAFVTIQLVDSGPGISPEVAERIFNPFFTTKDPSLATGLGLSIAKQLMTSSGGDLRHVQGEDHTTFEIMLRRGSGVSLREPA